MRSIYTIPNSGDDPIHIKDSLKAIFRDRDKAKDRVLFYYFGSCEGLPQPEQYAFFLRATQDNQSA